MGKLVSADLRPQDEQIVNLVAQKVGMTVKQYVRLCIINYTQAVIDAQEARINGSAAQGENSTTGTQSLADSGEGSELKASDSTAQAVGESGVDIHG